MQLPLFETPATIISVSGIRALDPGDRALVMRALIPHFRAAHEIRFGGARGVDTLALRTAHEMRAPTRRLVVYVPLTVIEQPSEARRAIEECADEVVELKLYDLWKRSIGAAMFERNRVYISTSHKLLAFPNVASPNKGGTANAIEIARRHRLPFEVVPVRAE